MKGVFLIHETYSICNWRHSSAGVECSFHRHNLVRKISVNHKQHLFSRCLRSIAVLILMKSVMFGVSQEELVALVWRHQESSPLEEPMSSLPQETLRPHQKQGGSSWKIIQQHELMFWSLTSAPSSLSGLLQTSSTRWNFLSTSWCNPLHLLLCLPFFDMKTSCASVKFIFSNVYHLLLF